MNLQKLIGGYIPQDMDARIKESIKLRAPFQHFATVMIQDREGIIKSIGQSKRNNLILDNFGTWLAGFMRAPVSGTEKQVLLIDAGGGDGYVFLYGTDTSPYEVFNSATGNTLGTTIMLGSGITAAARDDIAIETALATSPEDTFFDSGTGSYTAGVISCAGAITAGGNGTINEIGFFGNWYEELGNEVDEFMLFHDILVSGEAFVAVDTITATYTINL